MKKKFRSLVARAKSLIWGLDDQGRQVPIAQRIQPKGGALIHCALCYHGGHTGVTLYRVKCDDGETHWICEPHLRLAQTTSQGGTK